jgi:hypothetical protein
MPECGVLWKWKECASNNGGHLSSAIIWADFVYNLLTYGFVNCAVGLVMSKLS